MITEQNIKDASLEMRVFLPGLQSGYFILKEVALLSEVIRNNSSFYQVVDVKNEKDVTISLSETTELKEQKQTLQSNKEEKRESYRYIGADTLLKSNSLKNKIPLLPTSEYYETHPLPTREEIVRQFARLNISGDGRLTFLTLRSALEILFDSNKSTNIDDSMVRFWLRENDYGSKGYVDINDFQRIFRPNKDLSIRKGTQDFPRYRHIDANLSNKLSSSNSTNVIDSDRIARVKRLFFILILYFLII